MPSIPSGFNTFVPSFDATGHLVVAYSRNPKDFPINEWSNLTPVKKSIGYYLQVTAEQAARITNADLAEFVWPDSSDAPTGIWGDETFQFAQYNTTRYVYPFNLGYKAVDQADWQILSLYSAFVAQQAMTARTTLLVNAATNTANYSPTHVNTAEQWQAALGVPAANQAFFEAGTTENPVIKNTLNAMAQQIVLDTNGAIKRGDLYILVNPNTAAQMAASPEIQDYIRMSPFSMAQIRGDSESNNGIWGLADTLYGYKVICEDTVVVTSPKGTTRAASFALPDNVLIMGARPGELVSAAGGPSYGSFHIFAFEEMTVEQRQDPDNRRTMGRVVEDYSVQVVAPASAAYCSHLFS